MPAQKGIGYPEKDARAVAGIRIRPRRAAMRQVAQGLYAHGYDIVAGFSVQTADKTHSAGVVFAPRIIKADLLHAETSRTALVFPNGNLSDSAQFS
jgi:hypothetical protein